MSSEKHLEFKEYKYVSGQIIAREVYRNGKLEGICKLWHENGQLWNSISYRNGIKEGKREWWSANGRILMKEFFQNGKENGESKWYDKNGQLSIYEFYRDGEGYNFTNKNKNAFLRIKNRFIKREIYQLDQMLIFDLIGMI